ncbi:MAG: aldose 1-epimerase [Gemmatimonadaceae bacterium]|nr:aldose 1-epimerase [Chitinophagaceae bacterium]
MAFSTSQTERNGIRLVGLHEENGANIWIANDFGGMLYGFEVRNPAGEMVDVLDKYPDVVTLQAKIDKTFMGCKLSPFACRIPGGKYFYDDVEFEFSKKGDDGAAIHGLLYDKPLTVVDFFADDEQAQVLLKYNYKEEEDGYPFSYRCEIKYSLQANGLLQLQTTIINLDDLEIPLVDGWHPYFRLTDSLDDLCLSFNSGAMIVFDERLVPNGEIVHYDEFQEMKRLGDTVFDNCFLLEESVSAPACVLRNDKTGLEVRIFPDESYPYLQIYTGGVERKSIAIENLSASPDAFNNGMGLLQIPPRRSQTFTVYYRAGFDL